MEGIGACILVDEAGYCLSGGQDCVQWFFWESVTLLCF